MWQYGVLVVPIVLGLLALRTDRLVFKVGVPGTCGLILLVGVPEIIGPNWPVIFVVAALVFSMIGDVFLSNKGANEHFFVFGIGAYLFAHIGYGAFALFYGKMDWLALGVLLLGYLVYYLVKLRPAVDEPLLSAAVLCYLIVSCATLAAAIGMQQPAATRWLYAVGITLIVLSDTFISFNEFLAYRTFNGLILPTYYLAHISITLAILVRVGPGGGT